MQKTMTIKVKVPEYLTLKELEKSYFENQIFMGFEIKNNVVYAIIAEITIPYESCNICEVKHEEEERASDI